MATETKLGAGGSSGRSAEFVFTGLTAGAKQDEKKSGTDPGGNNRFHGGAA